MFIIGAHLALRFCRGEHTTSTLAEEQGAHRVHTPSYQQGKRTNHLR